MLLDIAFGLFAGNYFGYKVIGVLLALLPDIDFITHYFYIRKNSKLLKPFSRQGNLHTPFLYICIIGVLHLMNFDTKFIYLFLICITFHLIHDLFVLGRGVMILYPYSKNRLKLFPDDGKTGYLKKKYLWWNEDMEPKYSNIIKDDFDNRNWIRDWYFRPNLFLIIETSLAIILIFFTFA